MYIMFKVKYMRKKIKSSFTISSYSFITYFRKWTKKKGRLGGKVRNDTLHQRFFSSHEWVFRYIITYIHINIVKLLLGYLMGRTFKPKELINIVNSQIRFILMLKKY